MKKKVIIKIILSCISVAFFIFILFLSIKNCKNCISLLQHYKQVEGLRPEDYQSISNYYITNLIYHIVCPIPPLLLLVVIWLSDFKIISISLIKTVKEYRIKTAEQREIKRQSKIKRKIAQKQAEIERLNNSAKNE